MTYDEHAAPASASRPAAWTLGLLALLLLWDAAGLDLGLARLAGGPGGFAWRDHWLVTTVLHQGARYVAFLLGAWLVLGVWWPTWVLRDLRRSERVQWVASVLIAMVLINWLKHVSRTSCPWDLAEFGGHGSYLSHWAWGARDGGPGHCFPAGHASVGFAFVGGFFALRQLPGRAASVCLWLAVASGFVLGAAQQVRGAHFMSHTLWTAWLCWAAAWGVALVADAARGQQPVPAGVAP